MNNLYYRRSLSEYLRYGTEIINLNTFIDVDRDRLFLHWSVLLCFHWFVGSREPHAWGALRDAVYAICRGWKESGLGMWFVSALAEKMISTLKRRQAMRISER